MGVVWEKPGGVVPGVKKTLLGGKRKNHGKGCGVIRLFVLGKGPKKGSREKRCKKGFPKKGVPKGNTVVWWLGV